MNVEEAGELCRYFVNELSFSNLIRCFVHCVCTVHECVVRMDCAGRLCGLLNAFCNSAVSSEPLQ
jgi:hypothetical protein